MSGSAPARPNTKVAPYPYGLGATALPGGRTLFRVWAPDHECIEVHLLAPGDRAVGLDREDRGYHAAVIDDVEPGDRYYLRLPDGTERPDPCSRLQVEGVHGPSTVVGHDVRANVTGPRLDLADYVIYELHTGLFSPQGDFAGVAERLPYLRDLGINAIELMPVAAFPGERNWGYDGAYPYAVHSSYGGPAGLAALVDACHKAGIAVILDVVYNHLGPEGNYLRDFGPYFTDTYKTPWGAALNFDGPHSDEVRRFFIESALHFVRTFKVDALRVDAIHSIVDNSARPFLQDLTEAVHAAGREEGRPVYLIAESDLNDSRVLRSADDFGLGFDAQWMDDFHHSLHTLLTKESQGYYSDFAGVGHLARALDQGYIFSGHYSAFRRRSHGNSTAGLAPHRFVVCTQNHDQTGNRPFGDRLAGLVDFEGLKLAAGAMLLSGFVPLMFMGEEYGESAPFLYFTDHAAPDVVEGVQQGRLREFIEAHGSSEGAADPQSPETFERSRPRLPLDGTAEESTLRRLYTRLIQLRRELPGLKRESFEGQETAFDEAAQTLWLSRGEGSNRVYAAFNFSDADATVPGPAFAAANVIDSAATEWSGPGALSSDRLKPGDGVLQVRPHSFVLYKAQP